jgi:hypothetical protein
LLRLRGKEIPTMPTLADGQGQYLVVVQLSAWRAGQGWLPCGQQILDRRATSRRYDRGMNLQLPELLIIGVFLVFLIFFCGRRGVRRCSAREPASKVGRARSVLSITGVRLRWRSTQVAAFGGPVTFAAARGSRLVEETCAHGVEATRDRHADGCAQLVSACGIVCSAADRFWVGCIAWTAAVGSRARRGPHSIRPCDTPPVRESSFGTARFFSGLFLLIVAVIVTAGVIEKAWRRDGRSRGADLRDTVS